MKTRRTHRRIHHPVPHRTAKAVAHPIRTLSEHPGVPALLLTGVLAWLLSVLFSGIQLEGFSGGLWAAFG